MSLPTDIRTVAASLYFLPVTLRLPLKFGAETLTEVICARVHLEVESVTGHWRAAGWGETPLSVPWAWPSRLGHHERELAMMELCRRLALAWAAFGKEQGHAFELGYLFHKDVLPVVLADFNRERAAAGSGEPMPHLAALLCLSAFDLALHDAYGVLHNRPVYATYTRDFLSRDLSAYLAPAPGANVSFAGKHPADYLVAQPPARLPAWHLVGGKDLIDPVELVGTEPKDGYPVLLADWIRRDGLKCLKVKLRGDDAGWDYERLVAVGKIGIPEGAVWLSADFNCTVQDPAYVCEILDKLLADAPRIHQMLLYVEQPFPYQLELDRIDVHSVAARKPLFLDESAHDWEHVRLGRELGWSGVALKTCKTQTGALLSLAWAKAHGMTLMVQDLTNPMLAMIPHAHLAAYAGTIHGVETNAPQFYPEASQPEAAVHPGLYRRENGEIDLSSARGPGFGYRIDRIERELPAAAAAF